ncbi:MULTISPECIES: amidase [Lysinibacillus]|nr:MULTISPECIES: amidase [Lysinibacillus]
MMDIVTTGKRIQKKEISPVDLVNQSLKKIYEENPTNNSFITVSENEALNQAKILEAELIEGNIRGPLHGIPVAIKDLVYTKKIRTTMGSKIYETFIPTYDATVIKKLIAAGAVIIGKTNTHEFAYGPTGDRSYFGPCRNPHDLEKMSGGSSSGSAAAVAANMVAASIGTDTGGSIRIPSSACGVVGMKPTFGLVSKAGVFQLAYTLDHTGPITKTVKDSAILLNIIAGYDSEDPYSLIKDKEDYLRLIGKKLSGRTVGINSFYFNRVDEEVKSAVNKCISILKDLQVTVKEVNIPVMKEIAEAQSITIKSEASAVHIDTIINHKNEVDEEVYQRLVNSQRVKGYEYALSQLKRNKLIAQYNDVFSQIDVLIAPTLPTTAPNIGERKIVIEDTTESVQDALLRLTSPTNYTGNPSLSIPCGKAKNGLPIGVQLIAKHEEEATLYQFGEALEEALSINFSSK